jgi:hypothetical protein
VFLISPAGRQVVAHPARLTATWAAAALTIEVTVSSFSSYVAFLEGYARALISAETRWDRARTWLREVVQSANAEVRYAPDASPRGSLTVSFPGVRSDRDVSRLAQDVFALPGRLATARRRKVVVALDEFQAINGFNGGSVEHAMRAASAPARGGLRLAGSSPADGTHARPAPAVLQGRPIMRLERFPKTSSPPLSTDDSPVRASSGAASARPCRPRRQPPLRRPAPGARTWDEYARPGAGAPCSTICTWPSAA